MEPTIKKGQIIVVSRFHYLLSTPQKNDIVLLRPTKGIFEKGEWTHRVIGIKGDKITIQNSKVLVNDVPEKFSNLEHAEDQETIVPEGNIFQKGDNSKTIYGLIPENAVKGKIIFSF